MNSDTLREKAIVYRKRGKTYGEICSLLGQTIPQSTLSYWFKNVSLSHAGRERRAKTIQAMTKRARNAALEAKRKARVTYLESVHERNLHLGALINNRDVAKIILAVLYLGEGAKNPKRASVMLGSSDQRIISMFLGLLRYTYPTDERKFRCTLQCRADQEIEKLERFWSRVTRIPRKQFYRARIDPRTIGKPLKQLDYKGVCRVEYFSSEIFHGFLAIAEILTAGARSLEEKR